MAALEGIDGPAAPLLPPEVIAEAIPGSIRNAELFIQYMRHVVRFLRVRLGGDYRSDMQSVIY